MIVSWKAATAIVRAATFLLLSGCTAANLGIRPGAPVFNDEEPACRQFAELVNYSQTLQEAYHSRATQNRWWIYAAGTLALGTAAAAGGLGLAGGAGLTIGLLSLSGGFASGFFAYIDNPTLADIYTLSANQVGDALSKARGELRYDNEKGTLEPASCQEALKTLDNAVTLAKSGLESARTDSAAAAVARGKAQLDAFKKFLETATPTATAPATASPSPTITPTRQR